MLAKEIKIKNLMVQRKFITEQLKLRLENPCMDGDSTYNYIGYIFPENIKYLEDEGFSITKSSYVFNGRTGNFTLVSYYIHPSDNITLSEKEIAESEKIKVVSPTTTFVSGNFMDLLRNSFNDFEIEDDENRDDNSSDTSDD